eukprot:gene5424-6576_t
MSVVNQRAYLFGGCGFKDGKAQAFNDVFTLDFSTDVFKWEAVSIEGEKPGPRARHTATLVRLIVSQLLQISKNKVLVFGGLDRRKRFGDIWVFDTSTKKWEQPAVDGAPPTPRAHHSATLVGDKVFFFGGYSGHGKTSSDFYALELDGYLDPESEKPLTWTMPTLKGKGPGPRFDHSSTLYPNRYVIFGGQDNCEMFGDIHYLDLEKMAWDEEGGASPMTYSFEVCSQFAEAIESVPNYKVACIFGRKDLMEYSNYMEVMDCGSMTWSNPHSIGEPPEAREDTAIAYDNKQCRLIIFGGWANRWLGDLHTLNVATIIGPPYACMGCYPEFGPVFGDSEITVKGIKFRQANKIEVRFGSGKMEVIVEGKCVGSDTIVCRTPNYELFGAMEVDLKVNINGEGWTVNNIKYNYFANTSAKNCAAFGPGLQPEAMFGIEMPFLILAKDTSMCRRTSGGDKFVLTITHTNDPKGLYPGTWRSVDLDDGVYEVFYQVPAAGRYQIDVLYEDPQGVQTPIRGSPFFVECLDPWTTHRVAGVAPNKRKGTNFTTLGKDVLLYGGNNLGVTRINTAGDAWAWEQLEVGGDAVPHRSNQSSSVVPGGMLAVFSGLDLSNGHDLHDLNTLSQPSEGHFEWKTHTVADYAKRPVRLPKVAEEAPPEAEGAEGAPPPAAETEEGSKPQTPAAPPAEGEEGAAPADGEAAPPPAEGEEGEAAPAAEGEAAPAAEGETAPAAEGKAAPEENLAEEAVILAPPAPPVGRQFTSSCMVSGKKLITFGGECGGELINDFALVDMMAPEPQWVEPTVKGEVPFPCKGCLMAAANNNLYMFGGLARDDEEQDYLLESPNMIMYSFDAMSNSLTRQEIQTTGVVPEARWNGVFVPYAPNQLFLYGGMDAKNKAVNSAYLFDTQKAKWTMLYRADSELTPTAIGPICTLVGSKMITLNMNPGSPKFDLVQ